MEYKKNHKNWKKFNGIEWKKLNEIENVKLLFCGYLSVWFERPIKSSIQRNGLFDKNQSTKNQCLLSVKCCPRLSSPFQTFNGQTTIEIY